MVQVRYDGRSINPCKIRVGSAIFNRWGTGEIKDLSPDIAEKLLKNKDFSLVKGDKEIKEKKVKNEFDLNNDGVFDNKDVSIAAKTLREGKTLKKEKK